ncbi:MAG: MOSC domain-containing protein, partial [Halobacteriota archaeon]
FAIVDADDRFVNGKRERRLHRLDATYTGPDASIRSIAVETPAGTSKAFDVATASARAAFGEWLGDWLGYEVRIVRDTAGGFPDDTEAAGPTIVSTATIETVASWFDGIDPDGMRRRLRANVEVSGVPPFWEDRLVADRDHRVRFAIGDVTVLGVNPCQRCVVPSRDPDTGVAYEGFRETFVEKRRETMPEWSGGPWFDHDFRLMVNTDVPAGSRGESIAVGDEIRIEETIPVSP